MKEIVSPLITPVEGSENSPTGRVVRAFVVTLAPADEIWKRRNELLNRGEEDERISVLRVIVEVKGEEEGNRRFTLPGGNFEKKEPLGEASYREIGEEVGITPFGIPWQTGLGEFRYSTRRPNGEPIEREATLTYYPVHPCSLQQTPKGDPKVAELRSLSLPQLATLIREGKLDGVPMEGHLTLAESPKDPNPVYMSEEDIEKKNQALTRGLEWLGHIEGYFNKKLEEIFRSNPNITEKDFEKEYERVVSRFMSEGLKRALKERKVEEGEGFDWGCELRNKVLNGGFLGRDVLYYLPKIAIWGVDWPGLTEAPEGVRLFVKFLRDCFDEFLNEINLDFETFKTEMQNSEIPLQDKKKRIQSLDKLLRNKLTQVFGVDDSLLKAGLDNVREFFPRLSQEMAAADSGLTKGLYQDYVLRYEVSTAGYGDLLMLFFGIDTKENHEKFLPAIQFEAGRHLLLLLKSLVALPYYDRAIEKKGSLALAVNNFFGPWEDEKVVNLDGEKKMRVVIGRLNGEPVIVDVKPIKPFTSFLRKSFATPLENIRDVFSVSVVWLKELDPKGIKSRWQTLIDNFTDYLKTNFPDKEIKTFEPRYYGTDNFIKGKEVGKLSGVQMGSHSSRFVRMKCIIQLGDGFMELVFYPYCSLAGSGYWGWREVIAEHSNYIIRRLLAGRRGFPSLYDLFFPSPLYSRHFEHKLYSGYHRQNSCTG